MATKKTVIKKATSEGASSNASTTSSKVNVGSTNSNILNIILVLVVLQFLVILGMAVSMGSSNDETRGEHSQMLENMNSKVNDLDTFFRSNVQGYGSGSAADSVGDSNIGDSQAPDVGQPSIEGRPMIGSADAPITIVEYSDFECPFCGRFYTETYGELKEKYIDTGKAKLVFKNFPLSFHQLAKPAAISALCVYQELGDEKYFEMHDMIFEKQNSLSVENLKIWATDLGVSESDYDSCILDDDISDMVDEDFAEGAALGVSGTPSFVINGQLLVGAQPYSAFEQILESQMDSN